MKKEVLEMLQWRHLLRMVYGGFTRNSVTAKELESDGRSQKKAVNEAVEEGYLLNEPNANGEYPVTDKVYDEIDPVQLNLIEIWERQRERWNRNKNLPYVRIGSYNPGYITTPEFKALVKRAGEPTSTVEFYVARNRILDYDVKPGEGDIEGPYPLSKIGAEWHRKMMEQSTLPRDVEILVSTPVLREVVATLMFDENIERLYPQHLAWGLAKLNILDDDEADLIKSSESVFGFPGLIGGSSNFGNKPDEWSANAEAAVTNAVEAMAKLQRKLAVLWKLQLNMAKFSGWDKFLIAYKSVLIQTVRKQMEDKDGEGAGEAEEAAVQAEA